MSEHSDPIIASPWASKPATAAKPVAGPTVDPAIQAHVEALTKRMTDVLLSWSLSFAWTGGPQGLADVVVLTMGDGPEQQAVAVRLRAEIDDPSLRINLIPGYNAWYALRKR